MPFSGIIFDLDGTLADTLADIGDSMNRVLAANKFPYHPLEDYKLLVGKGLDNLVMQSLPVHARQTAIVARCLSQFIEDYTLNCVVKTCLYKGIKELLGELTAHNLKLAVFSNKAEPLTIKIIDHLLPEIPFVRVMGARPDFPKKPDPAGALFISEQMGINPENLLYLGDSDVDMITASRAGMYAVGVLWGFRTSKELTVNGAMKLLHHPLDLLEILA